MPDLPSNSVTGGAKIPVKEMALSSLDKMFPFLTPEQVQCMREGRPLPASPDYVNTTGGRDEQEKKITPVSATNPVTVAAFRAEKEKQLRDVTRSSLILEAMAASQPGPLVTAILVISAPERIRRARKAVAQFLAQVYPRKQLVIANASGVAVLTDSHPLIREATFSGSHTVGGLRNFGIQLAYGNFLYPHWDDDDVYDPYLLSYMVSGIDYGSAVALTTQVRVDVDNSNACYHHDSNGIPNTMLIPNVDAEPYRDITGGEDAVLWRERWRSTSTILDNSAWPVSGLKFCVRDTVGVAPISEFMSSHSNPGGTGRWELPPKEIEHVRAVFETFGLFAEPKIS